MPSITPDRSSSAIRPHVVVCIAPSPARQIGVDLPQRDSVAPGACRAAAAADLQDIRSLIRPPLGQIHLPPGCHPLTRSKDPPAGAESVRHMRLRW